MTQLPYQQTQFQISASTLQQCPPDEGFEVAFAGRSNAGKSSALNTITHQSKLARTSKTPGRTQLINFFHVTDQSRLVDLPGYGYAKVPIDVKEHWQRHLGDYLENRDCLRGLVLVMDVRHPLKEFDQQILQWAKASQLPTHILLTKADKLKRGPANASLLQVKKAVAEFDDLVSVQLFSALKKTGIEQVKIFLNQHLSPQTSTSDEATE